MFSVAIYQAQVIATFSLYRVLIGWFDSTESGIVLGMRCRWRKELWEEATVANVASAPSGRRWRDR